MIAVHYDCGAAFTNVESGKGEKPISPFERAFAGLVLGGEAFVQKIRALVEDRKQDAEQPAIGAL